MRKKIKKSIRKKINRKTRKFQFLTFIGVLTLGLAVSLLFPLRPTVSESEKRTLTPFPTLTAKALFDGTFFDGINIWFSDTYPFREALTGINSRISVLYGFGDRIYGLNNIPVDVIPSAPSEPITDFSDETIDENLGDEITVDNALVQNLGSIIVVNDSAYEVYSFNQKIADKYAYTLNTFSSKVQGGVNVYDLIVPTSIDITMPDNERVKYNSSSQADAIRYIFSCMSNSVKSVNVYNTLREHRTEYIYFRTDHHWTANGAYYAYRKLCNVMNIEPTDLSSDYTQYKFEGFKGSFYSDTNKNASLGNNPDTVFAFDPNAVTTLTYHTKSGKTQEWDVIRDVNGWNPTTLYSTFIGGDNPYTYITNETVQNGRKCVVVKESFGNALVPFIVSHYSEVHVIDYRYWNGALSDFIASKGIDDVVFVNNISATRNASLMNRLAGIAK